MYVHLPIIFFLFSFFFPPPPPPGLSSVFFPFLFFISLLPSLARSVALYISVFLILRFRFTTLLDLSCFPPSFYFSHSLIHQKTGKRRYSVKLWKTFTACLNCLPIAAIIDEKIFCMHGGLSPDLKTMEQIRRIVRPTDVPDQGPFPRHSFTVLAHPLFIFFCVCVCVCVCVCLLFTGLLCDLLWSDPDKNIQGWGENDRGVSFTFGADIVTNFLKRHDLDLICRAHQVIHPFTRFSGA